MICPFFFNWNYPFKWSLYCYQICMCTSFSVIVALASNEELCSESTHPYFLLPRENYFHYFEFFVANLFDIYLTISKYSTPQRELF